MKKSLRVKVYEKLKKDIIHFNLKPGEKIFEIDIAKEMKISRTPVREALLMLENDGVVNCDSRLGFIVSKLSQSDVEQYLALRECLEIFAAPLIIQNITASEIKALYENIKQATAYEEKKDYYNYIRRETEFHSILYNSTKSEVFVKTISSLIEKFEWLRAVSLRAPTAFNDSLGGHKKILAAVEAKDLKALKKVFKEHIREAKRYALAQDLFFL